jgi:tetratricopeptide (TPR) repeat protein
MATATSSVPACRSKITPNEPGEESDAAVHMKKIACLLLCLSLTALGDNPRVAALLKSGDVKNNRGNLKGALGDFLEAEKVEPNNVAVLLRIAEQYSDLIDVTRGSPEAEKNARASLRYSQRAVEIDPNNAHAHLSLSISYGKLTDFTDNKTKIEYSKLIRDEALKAIELNPNEDFAYHVLGRWHFGIANINPVLKLLTKMVYGSLPKASNQEAVQYLRKATEIAPQRIMHHYELARIYVALGQRDLARREWRKILDLPALDKQDEEERRIAAKSLRQ